MKKNININTMTREQRIKYFADLNAKGFEGDNYIANEINNLVEKYKIDQIIETGTYLGATTKRLAELAPVHTIEINQDNFSRAVEVLKKSVPNHPIIVSLGNSTEVLKEQLGNYKSKNILFFLDAHWQDYCPLLDELKLIAEFGLKPVIIIHDFKVPGKDFGYDSYKGQDFTFEWIQAGVEGIYGKDYRYHYNSEANGGYRGVIYIYPAI